MPFSPSYIKIIKTNQTNIKSSFLQQLVVLLSASQHLSRVLFLQLELLLLLFQLLDLAVVLADLLLINLCLFEHVLLETQSLLDQPVVFLLGKLALFGAKGGLVFLFELHLGVLL